MDDGCLESRGLEVIQQKILISSNSVVARVVVVGVYNILNFE
jgi:hypothetical protein